MKKWFVASILVLSGINMAWADAPPAKAQTCVACHGPAGVSSNPQWPNLAGQHAGYLAIQLKAFRDGSRDNPAMVPFVADLTDADIAALAKFYSEQKPGWRQMVIPRLLPWGRTSPATVWHATA